MPRATKLQQPDHPCLYNIFVRSTSATEALNGIGVPPEQLPLEDTIDRAGGECAVVYV